MRSKRYHFMNLENVRSVLKAPIFEAFLRKANVHIYERSVWWLHIENPCIINSNDPEKKEMKKRNDDNEVSFAATPGDMV